MNGINQSIHRLINLPQVPSTYIYLPAARQIASTSLPTSYTRTYLGGVIRSSPSLSLSLYQHVGMSHPTKHSVGRLTPPLRARVEDREG